MANTVTAFPVPKRSKTSYPWAEWLNGKRWKLTQGKDFSVAVHSMRTTAYFAGKRRGGKVLTVVDGDNLYIQFHKKSSN